MSSSGGGGGRSLLPETQVEFDDLLPVGTKVLGALLRARAWNGG